MIRPTQLSDICASRDFNVPTCSPLPEAEEVCYAFVDHHQIKGIVHLHGDNIITLSEYKTQRHNVRAAQKLLAYLQRHRRFLLAELTANQTELLKLYHLNGFKIINVSTNEHLQLCWSAGVSKYRRPRLKGES